MRIIIEGAGEVGSHVAKLLTSEGYDITVIDSDQSRLAALKSSVGVLTVPSSLTCISTLKECHVEDADLFIAVNPGVPQDVNIVSALLAKNLGCRKVTARIDDEEFLSSENKLMFKQMGLDLMFYPEKIAADEIHALLRENSSSDAMEIARGKLQLEVFKVDDESPMLDLTVVEFIRLAAEKVPGTDLRIAAISTSGKTVIPRFDTRFRWGDLVYVIATKEGMAALKGLLRLDRMKVRSVMVMGGSPIGEMLVSGLHKTMDSIKIIDKNIERCRALTEHFDAIGADNVDVVAGDGRNADFLADESIRDYDAFVAVTGNDEANILSCIGAKKAGVRRVIAEVENIEYLRLAEDLGVDAVINKKMITAGRIFKFTLSDKVRSVRYMAGTNAEVLEYTVAPGSAITKAPLKDLDWPRDSVIGGLIRGGAACIAVGNTLIEPYDRVVVFALPDAVRDVDKFFR